MKTGTFSVRKELVFGLITALSIATTPFALSQSAYLAETASVMGACGKLFDVDANAAGLTAQERASIIQKNLDHAIVHAHNRAPSAVQVKMVNRNPVVTFDGFHIATADGNSATRNNMTQMQLAEKWASSIKFCLADAAAIDKYLAMLTGNYKKVVAVPRSETVAVAPAGMFLPVKLTTPINSETSQIGDRIEAVLSTDVPLKTSQSATTFEAYLPAGTIACGQLVEASNAYLGRNAFQVRFDTLRTPDGEIIPVNAHVLGGVGTWVVFGTQNRVTEFAMINGIKPSTAIGQTAAKGQICGAWRGAPGGASVDIPYQKLVFARRTGIAVPCGEPMIVQLAATTAIAVCTNCGSSGAM